MAFCFRDAHLLSSAFAHKIKFLSMGVHSGLLKPLLTGGSLLGNLSDRIQRCFVGQNVFLHIIRLGIDRLPLLKSSSRNDGDFHRRFPLHSDDRPQRTRGMDRHAFRAGSSCVGMPYKSVPPLQAAALQPLNYMTLQPVAHDMHIKGCF